MPNPLSWYFHHLPKPLHRVEVAANHVAQLAAPLALFLPQPGAAAAGVLIVVTQSWLVASGNFSWLNVLTIVLAFSAIHDSWLAWLPVTPPAAQAQPLWFAVVVLAVAAVVVVLSWEPARNLLSRAQLMNASFNRFHLVNTYGAFGSITRERYEVVIEGTDSERLDGGVVWRDRPRQDARRGLAGPTPRNPRPRGLHGEGGGAIAEKAYCSQYESTE